MPTILRWEEFFASAVVIFPEIRLKKHHILFASSQDADVTHFYKSLRLKLTCFNQIYQQVFPLCPELVGTCETAVTSNNTQVGDAQLDQVTGRLGATLLGTEVLTAGTTNHSSTLMSDRKKGFQSQMRMTRRHGNSLGGRI